MDIRNLLIKNAEQIHSVRKCFTTYVKFAGRYFSQLDNRDIVKLITGLFVVASVFFVVYKYFRKSSNNKVKKVEPPSSKTTDSTVEKIEKVQVRQLNGSPLDRIGDLPLDPELPLYLDELAKEGYVHLSDYLFKMKALSERNARRTAIGDISFSSLSYIILETKEAIIRKVEHSLPLGFQHLPKNFQRILLIIRRTGSGKSTKTLSFL